MRLALLIAFAVTATGCSAALRPAGVISQKSAAWHEVVTRDDRDRLRDWRPTFTAALAAARKSGHSAEIDREGTLLQPDAAVGGGPPPNGAYRCRVIKLGAKAQGNLDFVAYPFFVCRIEVDRGLQRLTKVGGSQRYVGLIFPGDAMRQIFLGTLVLGDEAQFLQYGQDETRDIAGFVERVSRNRWRLIMPKPHFESQLDVMELVPLSQ